MTGIHADAGRPITPVRRQHDCRPWRGWVFAQRFDRMGTLGRKAVVSLAALDAKFVGAAEPAEVLWAFGALIGNTDMHAGNLSWVSEHGRPYNIAPAYDMTPMAFAPSSSGKLPNTVPAMTLHASVRNDHWRTAQAMAQSYLAALRASPQLSTDFEVCLDALAAHMDSASKQIARLA